MKTSYLVSLALFLSSMLTHLYLSFRSYSLKADKAIGKNLCHIGENWNCDQALTSIFAEIFSLPISNFGFAFNALCFFGLILIKWEWLESRKIWSNLIWIISLLLALASLVMFLISLIFLKSFCPFCTLCYILSIAVIWRLKLTLPSSQIFWRPKSFSSIFHPALWIVALIIGQVYLIQAIGLEIYPVRQLKSLAKANFIDWKTESPNSLLLKKDHSFLSSGPPRSKAKLVLVEFADLLCPHCAKAYFVLKTFQTIRKNVRMEYMSFPLNSRGCTEKTFSNTPSPSCYLSKSIFCAEKQKLGLKVQDLIYQNQNWFLSHRETVSVQNKVKEYLNDLQANMNSFQSCVQSASTKKAISNQVVKGKQLGLTGTPSLFVEGRKVRPIAIQMTLDSIIKSKQTR